MNEVSRSSGDFRGWEFYHGKQAREFASSSDNDGILPGYHMNKNNWITVVLDYGVAMDEVLALIDKSYRIVACGE